MENADSQIKSGGTNMTINDFKNLDEIPWDKHRLMGDFLLRQNEMVRNNSYWNVLKFFRDEIISNDKESGTTVLEGNKKREIYMLLLRERLIPPYIEYSGIVKGVIGDAFVMDIIREAEQGEYGFQNAMELHTDIFKSYEERNEQRQKYIDFELSNFKEYINESEFINESKSTKQFIIDVIGEVLR